MSDIRIRRVESLLQDEIGLLIVTHRIKDPRVSPFLTVTRVQAARDFSFARVFISSFESEPDLTQGVEALNHAAGFIQVEVAKKLKTRQTPKLNFVGDNSILKSMELNRKIEELHRDEA
ncbi:MAG: 30S ribosome-binding factor RbfA [Spirochaetales bacterium]|jgi:ribosome-binding factor A|nr:30S ribosome-binding factor RbfA [Spirochaetales bacterium]